MPVQISVFTSGHAWWKRPWYRRPGEVTDVFPRAEEFKAGRATLLSAGDGTVSGIARGGRRGSASTFDSKVTFEQVAEIDPIPVGDLASAVRPHSRPTVRIIFTRGYGTLSEAASSDIRGWLAERHPATSGLLEDVLDTERSWMTTSPELAAQHREQRDAVKVAVEIAGFDRAELLGGIQTPTEADHFNLDGAVLSSEDSTIPADIEVFPGFERVRATMHPSGRVFEDPASRRRLTVLLANKNEIERAVGVELVYFVPEYGAFVLVQYKRVTSEGRARVVRLDDQLDKELTRTREVESELGAGDSSPAGLPDQRLSAGTCFFKLCESYQPGEVTDLSRGKYLPLATWDAMADAGMMTGPRGGRRLGYDTVARYLNNTTFAALVSEGWVGSTRRESDKLIDLVSTHVDEGRSVVVGALWLGATSRRLGQAAPRIRSRAL